MTKHSRALPPPRWERLGLLGDALVSRRSVRGYLPGPIPDEDLSVIFASAAGITDARSGFRAAPSGGACYPLDLFLASQRGIEKYEPDGHILSGVGDKDVRTDLARHSHGQGFVAQAASTFIIIADYSRITGRYGRRGIRYALLEAGHMAQNIHLAAVSLCYGSVPVGAFDDDALGAVMGGEVGDVVYLIPVGRPR